MTVTTTNSSARRPRRLAAFLTAAAAAVCVSVAAAAPASAGNIASVMSSCSNGAASVSVEHNMDYEYARVWKYDYALGWIGGNQWQRLSVTAAQDLGTQMAGQSGWFAVYVQFADWNGASWDISGQWVQMNHTDGSVGYWCR